MLASQRRQALKGRLTRDGVDVGRRGAGRRREWRVRAIERARAILPFPLPLFQVRRVDQDAINEFGRLNLRRVELREDLAEMAKRADELGDAEEAVMMADEDGNPGALKVLVGECFDDVDGAAAATFVQEALAVAKERRDSAERELKLVEGRMGELKKVLYARFGKSINLEE